MRDNSGDLVPDPDKHFADATPSTKIWDMDFNRVAGNGGSTTSILVNIPGEAASVVTCLDGYQMCKRGRAGPALALVAVGSFVAGTLGILGLQFFAPMLGNAALWMSHVMVESKYQVEIKPLLERARAAGALSPQDERFLASLKAV